MVEINFNAKTMRRYRILKTREYYIYIIYTWNLKLKIVILNRKKKQNYFTESSERTKRRSKKALKRHKKTSRKY